MRSLRRCGRTGSIGVDSDDQQAITKTLIKLRMDADSAEVFAKITGWIRAC